MAAPPNEDQAALMPADTVEGRSMQADSARPSQRQYSRRALLLALTEVALEQVGFVTIH